MEHVVGMSSDKPPWVVKLEEGCLVGEGMVVVGEGWTRTVPNLGYGRNVIRDVHEGKGGCGELHKWCNQHANFEYVRLMHIHENYPK